MRNNDPRSRCIAILPDALVNGHLLALGDPRREPLLRAFAFLDDAGFGVVQLPPDDLAVERARASLDFALDHGTPRGGTSSGRVMTTTSACLTASATGSGLKPCSMASLPLAESLRFATITLTPESRRFCAWAWPCEP